MKTHSGGFSEEAFWLLGPEAGESFDAMEHHPVSVGSKTFEDAGFYVMRSRQSYVLVCCNVVGTGGKGNHRHNDLVSCELSMRDTPLTVDPGTYVYTSEPDWRNYFRSTSCHNTIVIDGQEQNRLRQGQLFRLTPDANPIVHQWPQ